jgi:hypothetical protein
MFDIDSRSILFEFETDVYVLGIILGALPSMAGVIWQDGKLRRLYEAMCERVCELSPDVKNGQDIEKMLVCGFSAVI